MKMVEISEDPKMIYLLEKRDLKKRTAESYLTHIRRYCEFNEMTPTELIEEARTEQVKFEWMDQRKLPIRLMKFHKHIEPNFTYKTRKLSMGIVRTFYNEFEIVLPKIKVKESPDEKRESKEQKIPTIEHIRDAVENSNPKYGAMILLLATSGMSKNEMKHLTLKDYYQSLGMEEYDPSIIRELNEHVPSNTIPTFDKIIRRKTGVEYTTFCTPEAMKYINKYLKREYRNKEPPEDPETKLFIPFQMEKNNSGMISDQSIAIYFRKLNTKLEWGKSGRFIFFHPHTLRRFFATTLTTKRVSELYSHWLLGHKIDPVTEAYFKSDPESLKREYRRLIPYLSIKDTSVEVIEDDQVREMKNEMAEIRRENKELRDAVTEMERKRAEDKVSDYEHTPPPG